MHEGRHSTHGSAGQRRVQEAMDETRHRSDAAFAEAIEARKRRNAQRN